LREQQAGGKPGGGADQRVGDPGGGRRVRIHREDQHRANRHLEHVVPEVQRHADRERGGDQQPEYPPAERHVRGHANGGEHADGDAEHLLRGHTDGLVQRGLRDQQRGQRCEHRTGRTGQHQREQVRKNGS
jgi:hypothetical protein